MIGSAMIDARLLEMRSVIDSDADPSGMGYEAHLACGHDIWMATLPLAKVYCAVCLSVLMRQIDAVRQHQEPR